jgi:Phage terminase, small subunit
MLQLACQAVDRAERVRAVIDREGEMVETQHGSRAHSLLREEQKYLALAASMLSKLGLQFEPVRPVGRPPGQLGG